MARPTQRPAGSRGRDPGLDAQYAWASELRQSGRAAESLPHFRAVLARAPHRWDAWADYGNALADLDRHADALEAFGKALARRPGEPRVLQNRGIALLETNDPVAAGADFRQALAGGGEAASLRFDLALAHLLSGDLATGFALYEARFGDPRLRTPPRPLPYPRWSGTEPLAGQRILLHAEQGLGDTLQFARYVPLVAARGATVVLEAPAPLAGLLGQLDGVTAVVARGGPLPDVDWHCPLGSLPLAFGTTLASIPAGVPYLRAEPGDVAGWRAAPGDRRPRVGLVWAGNPRHRNDRRRSLPLAALAPLARGPWQLVGLQKDIGLDDAQRLAGWQAIDAGPRLRDFAATAAALTALDLVVTVDTAVAHLAGALGRPAWVLLPYAPDWRWLLGRADSPWYPTLRLFRQPRPGDWASVVRLVTAALAELAGGPASRRD
jgi:hypothetical protein